MTSFVPPTAPTLQRADTNKTMHPPGAWTDDAPNSGAYDDAGESPIAAVGNTLSSAFTAAGSMAANYLPASVVGQIANYAPAMVPQSTKGLDEVKNSDPPAPDIHKPNDRSLNTFSDSKPLESSPNKPLDASLDKPFESPLNKPLDTSLNKASPNDISQPTQFASPSAVSPLSPEKLPGTTNTGSGDPFSPLSTVATLGHAYGTDAPPPSAATNSAVPSRDTSLPFSSGIGSSTDSEAGYKSIATKYASPTSTGQVGSGPTQSGTNSSVPSRDTSLPFSTSSGIGGSMSSSGAGYKPFDEKEHHVPSSTISMKSGHIGSGPTHTGTGDSITGNLPPIASPVADGITPGASELEKDDLHYLAPAIASRDKVVPTTAAASKPLIETSKFAEDLSAHPTPASAHSSANSPVSAGGHSRNASGASSVSVGGSPKRKVTLANRIKGEAKILSGKLTKDTAKVQQGRDILSGEV